MRRLIVLAAALLGVAWFGAAQLGAAVHADAPTADLLYGSVTVDGANAAVGAVVTVSTGLATCGSTQYDGALYRLALPTSGPCFVPGNPLTFTVDGRPAHEHASVAPIIANITRRDLTVGVAPPPQPVAAVVPPISAPPPVPQPAIASNYDASAPTTDDAAADAALTPAVLTQQAPSGAATAAAPPAPVTTGLPSAPVSSGIQPLAPGPYPPSCPTGVIPGGNGRGPTLCADGCTSQSAGSGTCSGHGGEALDDQ